MTTPTSSASWIAGLGVMFAAQGLDAAALFRDAGIDPALRADDLDARVDTDTLSRLWLLAAERSGREIGLAPAAAPMGSFEVLGYAMLSCANLREGFDRVARFVHVVTQAGTVTLHDADETTRLQFHLRGGELPVPRQRYEFDLLAFIALCRWIGGREPKLRAAELAQPAPADPAPHARAFGCPMRFGAPAYALLFDRAELLRPLPSSNAALAALHEGYLAERLDRLGRAQVTQRTREQIVRRLPDGEPGRERIAAALHMSERTLQRRLQDEGTSFHELLDTTRRELAQQYLHQRRVTLTQAAYLLGFAEQSNFSRACKRWFGASPGRLRTASARA